MKVLSSPLRYPGSKIRLVRYLQKVIEFNEFTPDVLVEPFVGGGSVFLNLLENGVAAKAVVGDKDLLIASFWRTVFENPQHLVDFVSRVKVNADTWYYYKLIVSDESRFDTKTLAEACLFLNRTSFSGLLTDDSGPIGGWNRQSDYQIDCRFNRAQLKAKIIHFSTLADRVQVLHSDWNDTIKYAVTRYSKQNLLFYLDPPFFRKADRLYRQFFENEACHVALSRTLKQMRHRWILSYDRAREIKNLYRSYVHGHFAFPYSINSPARRIEKEYFITSKHFKPPTKKFLER